MEGQRYLNLTQQCSIIERLRIDIDRAPLDNKLFCGHGNKFSIAATSIAGLVFWRTGFRAFNLYRYGKGRALSVMIAAACVAPASSCYSYFCHEKLFDYYRPENMLYYGATAIWSQELGLAFNMTTTIVYTFLHAHMVGILPIPEELHKAGNRQVALRFMFERLRPYWKTLVKTHVATSIFMSFIGMAGYYQSLNYLALQNRRTISYVEETN